MAYFEYSDSPYPIRDDIKAAHRAFWVRLASPGCWWTGAERIAIAGEIREATGCGLCQERKAALSPYTFGREHEATHVLSAEAVDAVHRVVTDQGRITQAYVDSNAELGLSNEAYVELAGIVVAAFSIDEFHRALGLTLEPLPDAAAGEPSHYRPQQAAHQVGYVPMIPADGATGDEADLWQGGRTANVLRALSLVPDALRDWQRLASAQYLSMKAMASFDQLPERSLSRMQMELVAARVSSINECFY